MGNKKQPDKNNPLYQMQIKRYDREGLDIPVNPLRLNAVINLAGENKKILDLGCYYPWVDEKLKEYNNEVIGLDLSKEVVRRTRQKCFEAYVCNLETDLWPVKKNYFDVVIAGDIIEHMIDTDQFLQNIHQVLGPKGKLILTTPNLASLGRRLLLLLGRNPVIETSLDIERGGHVRYFVKESLFILLEQNGFEVETFTSEVVLFNETQTLYSTFLAKTFPTIGKSLIVKAKKV